MRPRAPALDVARAQSRGLAVERQRLALAIESSPRSVSWPTPTMTGRCASIAVSYQPGCRSTNVPPQDLTFPAHTGRTVAGQSSPMELPAFIPIFRSPNVVLFPGRAVAAAHLRAALSRDGPRRARGLGPDRHGACCAAIGRRTTTVRPRSTAPAVSGRSSRRRRCPTASSTSSSPGVSEFEILSEQRERAYRQATVEWRDPPRPTRSPRRPPRRACAR